MEYVLFEKNLEGGLKKYLGISEIYNFSDHV